VKGSAEGFLRKT